MREEGRISGGGRDLEDGERSGERRDAGGKEDQWEEKRCGRTRRSVEICRSEVSWQGKGRAATYRNCCLEFVYFLKKEK